MPHRYVGKPMPAQVQPRARRRFDTADDAAVLLLEGFGQFIHQAELIRTAGGNHNLLIIRLDDTGRIDRTPGGEQTPYR